MFTITWCLMVCFFHGVFFLLFTASVRSRSLDQTYSMEYFQLFLVWHQNLLQDLNEAYGIWALAQMLRV